MTHFGFTFGIITNSDNFESLLPVIKSIEELKIPNFEILIVGGNFHGIEFPDYVKHIIFDESIRTAWITRKKNLIAELAKFQNLVICHDYIAFMPGWYQGFLKFGFDWDVAMNKVTDIRGRRFYDWVFWDHPIFPRYSPADYSDANSSRFLFVPGAYWVVKKTFMLENPLNESLSWGQSEDVEWSLRVREFRYRMNPYSEVRHVKKHRGYKWWKSVY